jgi:hypothetical protein
MARQKSVPAALIALAVELFKAVRAARPQRPARAPGPTKRADVIVFGTPDRTAQWRRLAPLDQELESDADHQLAIAEFRQHGTRTLIIVRSEGGEDHPLPRFSVLAVWKGDQRMTLGILPREISRKIAAGRPADLPIRVNPVMLQADKGRLRFVVALYEPGVRTAYWESRGGAPRALT